MRYLIILLIFLDILFAQTVRRRYDELRVDNSFYIEDKNIFDELNAIDSLYEDMNGDPSSEGFEATNIRTHISSMKVYNVKDYGAVVY